MGLSQRELARLISGMLIDPESGERIRSEVQLVCTRRDRSAVVYVDEFDVIQSLSTTAGEVAEALGVDPVQQQLLDRLVVAIATALSAERPISYR